MKKYLLILLLMIILALPLSACGGTDFEPVSLVKVEPGTNHCTQATARNAADLAAMSIEGYTRGSCPTP